MTAYSPTWCPVPFPGTGSLCRLPGWPHDDHVATAPDGSDVRWATTCAHDVRHANTGHCTRCGQNGGTR